MLGHADCFSLLEAEMINGWEDGHGKFQMAQELSSNDRLSKSKEFPGVTPATVLTDTPSPLPSHDPNPSVLILILKLSVSLSLLYSILTAHQCYENWMEIWNFAIPLTKFGTE